MTLISLSLFISRIEPAAIRLTVESLPSVNSDILSVFGLCLYVTVIFNESFFADASKQIHILSTTIMQNIGINIRPNTLIININTPAK